MGIAAATTLLDRTAGSPPPSRRARHALRRARAVIFASVSRQASMPAFISVFRLPGLMFLLPPPLALLMRRPGGARPAQAALH